MSMNQNIQSCFAYNGSEFTLVEDNIAVQLVGNAIVLWNTMTNKKNYIWSKRNGYCAVSSNYNVGQIAAAEYGLKPEVHIYRASDRELINSFPMDTTVKCIGMAFSRSGKFLIMVGGVPDFRISIFDIEQNKKMVIPETKLPCKADEYLSVKFNPQNNMQFCILSQTVLYTYIIHQAYDVTERGEQKFLGESFRLESSEYRDENPDLTFIKFCWDPYDRVHISTDQPIIIQVDPKFNKLENCLNLTHRAACTLMTQKHLIVSQEEGLIQWFKLNLPEIVIGEKDLHARKLTCSEEVEQEWNLGLTIGETGENEFIAHMHYTKSFKQLIMGTHTGLFGRLEVQAEAINYEEDEEEAQQDKEKKIIESPFVELGRFHTKKLTGIKELGETTQLITISEDHYMTVWEATTQSPLASVYQPSHPTSLDVSHDGTCSFIGTAKGAFRIYDLTDRTAPKLVQQIKFFEDGTSIDHIQASHDGKLIFIGSKSKQDMYILSQDSNKGFKVYGFVHFEGFVISSCFSVQNGSLTILAVLSNNLLAGFKAPIVPAVNRREAFTEEEIQIFYRKVDRGTNIVMANSQNQDIYVSGEDKLLKKYEFPQLPWANIEFKKPPPAPLQELPNHSIGTVCWDVSKGGKQFATGGKDGMVLLRNLSNIGHPNEIRAHTLFSGGVTAICFSNTRSTLYSAGGDGSLLAWTIGGKPNPSTPIQLAPGLGAQLQEMPEIERVPPDQIKMFSVIIFEEFQREQASAKESFRQECLSELNQIKDNLLQLLAENEQATEIEMLIRDEFVIDTIRRDNIEREGYQECEEIRMEAEKTVLRLELLRERVKESTWDKMQDQQRAIKSIQSDTLIFNYPIRERTDTQMRRLQMVINTRKIELKEKMNRIENNLKESMDEDEFSMFKEEYLMNRVKGKPSFTDDESIKEAAQEFADKEVEKKVKKDKMEMSIQNAANPNAVGKKQPILKITKGKLGVKRLRKDEEDDDPNKGNKKYIAREIKGMEEMYWKIEFQVKQLEEIKKTLNKPNIFDLVYEPYELSADGRKLNQIQLLQGVVFELKKDFNDEFDSLDSYKQEQLYNIKDRNETITELLFQLGQEEELFEPKGHPLEDPENIFHIAEDEIKVEKYLTKEERAALDEQERIRLEREALLRGDNVGQRGLKAMMGGTELNLKKDKGAIDFDLVLEDWMNKPEEEMTDEERIKLKEFRQQEKEFKDKQRKAWEQELKKVKADIVEIKLRFEERLLMLFKKKLFIDVRVLEQELFIIRLVIMLHDGKETRFDERKYRKEMQEFEFKRQEKEDLIQTFKGFAQDLETKYGDDQSTREQEKELKRMFPDAGWRQILNFVKNGKGKKELKHGEIGAREKDLTKDIVELDPFSGTDREHIKKQLKDDEEREHFDYEKDNVAGLNEDEFERLVQERYSRVDMNKDKDKVENQMKQLQNHINYLEESYREIEDNQESQTIAQKKALDRIQKIRYNFEMIAYLRQGQIEVPQLPVATDYKDAILIQKDLIDFENKEITRKGEQKIKLMNEISNFKVNLKKVSFQKMRLDLEITDFEERAKDVQLYRVTKQTQEIIQGKHQKKDEEDKKRLENQIKQLEENAAKRIKTINETKQKLKREIKEKMQESEQLETKARQLQNNVDQRNQIMNLKSNTKTDGQADPTKRIKEVAHKRKLLDIAKQQTEEIEVLRDELDRLRARTFPSFAHLHNKQGYPDDNAN